MPEDKSKKPDAALIIGMGAPSGDDDKPGAFLPKDFLGEHGADLKDGDEFVITLKGKVNSADEEGADVTFTSCEDCKPVNDSDEEDDMGYGTDESGDLAERFREHNKKKPSDKVGDSQDANMD